MGQHARPESKKKSKSAPTPKLKRGVLRVPRHDGVYIGPKDHGVTITGVGALAVTELLDGSHSRLDISISTGTPRERVDHIINLLASKALLDSDYQENAYTPAIAERIEPELSAISYREGVDDGGLSLFHQRSAQSVDVWGLDRVGSIVVSLLSASGVGAVRGFDQRKVSPADVAGGIYRMSDVGEDRCQVVESIARDSAPLEPRRARNLPDLAILCAYPTPEDLMQLSLSGRPYLIVSSDPRVITLGPLVLPSKSACARCIALHRSDSDSQWGSLEMARLAEERRYIPSAAMAAMAASFAAAQALTFLDTGSAELISHTMHIDPSTGLADLHPWTKHSLCGCSWGNYHHS